MTIFEKSAKQAFRERIQSWVRDKYRSLVNTSHKKATMSLFWMLFESSMSPTLADVRFRGCQSPLCCQPYPMSQVLRFPYRTSMRPGFVSFVLLGKN